MELQITAFPILALHDGAILLALLADGGRFGVSVWMALEPAVAKRLVRILPAWQPMPIVPSALYSDSSRFSNFLQ